MEPPICQLIRAGLVNDVQEILVHKVPTKEIFLQHIGSYLHQFIGLTARHGSIEILQRCIDYYGVEVKIGHEYGLHALVGAASQGHDHIIKWLVNPWIENGRQINGQKHFDKVNLPQGWLCPSLHKAVRGQHASTVKLLLQEAWAAVDAQDETGLTPIEVATTHFKKATSKNKKKSPAKEIIDILKTADLLAYIDKTIRLTEEYNEIDKDNSILVATKFTSVKSWFEAYDKQQYIEDGCLHIKDPLQNLDTKQLKSAEAFLEPQNHITIMHLAACSGKLETLKRADELGVDLYVGDIYGRSALHYAAAGGQIKVVRWFLKRSNEHNKLSNQDKDGKTSLHLAVEEKHVKVVKLLVDAKVNLNVADNKDCTPIHLASKNVLQKNLKSISDYEKIVEILTFSQDFKRLTDNPWVEGDRSILNNAVKIDSNRALNVLLDRGLDIQKMGQQPLITPLHIAARAGSHKTVGRLLESFKETINMKDKNGRMPLHVAVKRHHSKCAQTLLDNGASLTSVDKDDMTVLQFLFQFYKHPVDFLTNVLDGRIDAVGKKKDEVTLNFKDLIPKDCREMTVVSALKSAASMKEMKILAHPLVEAFLAMKWMHFRPFYVVHLIFQVLFVAYLSLYVILLQLGWNHWSLRWLLIPFAISMVYPDGIERLKCDKLQRVIVPKYHWKHYETWLSFICAMTCIVVPVAGEYGQTQSWVLVFISISLIAAYIQMMLLIGIFPSWEYYGLMFETVLKKVFKILLGVIGIIVGFAFSLSTLFYNDDELRRPWTAIVKTVVMMTGEYDYNNLFDRTDNNNSTLINSDSNTNHSIVLAITARIILLAFVIFASIVLMNLITALAIVDVQELLNKVHIRHLMKRIELLSNLELKCQNQWLFKRLKKYLKIRENIGPKPSFLKLLTHDTQKRGISKELADKLIDHISKSRCHYNRHNMRASILTLKSRDSAINEYEKDSSSSDKTKDSLVAVQKSLKKIEQSMDESQRQQLTHGPSCPANTEDRLMAIEASLESIKQSIRNGQIQRLAQDPNIKRKRRSV